MDKLILTDIDGVALDWEGHFHNYMKSHGHERAYDNNNYWQELNYPSLSVEEAKKIVYHFNTSAWMVDVPPLRDARSGIARLKDAGYRFIAVTALGDDPYAKQVREINLERVFGYNTFEDVIFTDMYDPDSKVKTLSHWGGRGLPWIEDKWSNCLIGHKLGYQTFLMDHLYNRDSNLDGIIRVANWNELCDHLLK